MARVTHLGGVLGPPVQDSGGPLNDLGTLVASMNLSAHTQTPSTPVLRKGRWEEEGKAGLFFFFTNSPYLVVNKRN